MKRFYLAIAVFCLLLIPRAAHACLCVNRNPASAFNEAKAVFIGQMLGGTQRLSQPDRDGKSQSLEAGKVRFLVAELFKGNVSGETTILIASGVGTDCGPYGLVPGERYVVYAYGDEDGGEELYSGTCTRTALLNSSNAKEDLDFLRNLPPPGTGGNLRGGVGVASTFGFLGPLPSVKITITNASKETVTVQTDAAGRFEVRGVKPGRYQVEAEPPANYFSDETSYEVTIDDRGTADVGFEVHIKGRVLGRIVDRDGRDFNFNSMLLNLEADGEAIPSKYNIRASPQFEIAGVPPGDYVLCLSMPGADFKSTRKFYYPGTFSRDKASVITVGLAETVKDLEFVLPDTFKVRTVEGQVSWGDGTAAAGVTVGLTCRKSGVPGGLRIAFDPIGTITDARGRFHLEGLTGEIYSIVAQGSKDGRREEKDQVHSVARRIVLTDDLKNTNLVLSDRGNPPLCKN